MLKVAMREGILRTATFLAYDFSEESVEYLGKILLQARFIRKLSPVQSSKCHKPRSNRPRVIA